MATLESLSDLLETTGDIRAIVRVMKSLSAVSIRQYEEAAEALSGYDRTIELGLTALLHDRNARGLPLPGAAATGRSGVVVIGSDRGLCGRYNDVVARFAETRLEAGGCLAVIGAQPAARLEAAGHVPDRLFALPGSVAGMGTLVQSVIRAIDGWTREAGVGRVRLIHNDRAGRATAVPRERDFLPLPASYLEGLLRSPWPARGVPAYRMPPERLLSWLVQQRAFVTLYRALAEAMASEHATRLAAMQAAERNIEERQADLAGAYRRKRQETITRELLDVVAGYEAVGGADT